MRYSIIDATVEQVKSAGGRDIKEAPGTGIMFAVLDEAGVALLQSLGARVKKVGEVKPTDIAPPTPIPVEEGYSPLDLMAAIGFTDEWRYIIEPPLYGEGFGAAILDSGIRETHELVKGRVVYSRNFTASPAGDRFSHGTGVASIVTAIAPKCDLIDIKVIGDDGVGTDEAVIMGIGEVINLKETHADIFPYVINLSLGKEDDGDPFDPLRVACRAAIEKGIFVVAAAGNFGPQMGTIMSPASERYVGAVGSVVVDPQDPQKSFLVSAFSSRGPTKEGLIKPDSVLPGERIIMADARSDTAMVVKSGTSFAVSLGAAIIALHGEGAMKRAYTLPKYLAPGLPAEWVPMTPQELLDKWTPLLTVKPVGAPRGKDVEYGWGIPFGELAALALTGRLPAAATGDIVNMIAPIMLLGMMGMAVGSMFKSNPGNTVLEPNWWSGYTYDDMPSAVKNPHFKSVYDQASPDKQDLAKMAVAIWREPNSRKKAQKYQYLKERLEYYSVFIDITPEQVVRGRMEDLYVVAAAIMEVYTPSGLYSRLGR